jgi:Arc/MetJ-type ribon-helix-helix transcriptional regulator
MTKGRISLSLPPEDIEWLEKKVRNQDYGSISHGVAVCIRNEMKREGLIKDEQ